MANGNTQLIIAGVALLALGGGAYVVMNGNAEAAKKYDAAAASAELPKVELGDAAKKAVDRIVIHRPAEKKDDGKGDEALDVELTKKDGKWRVTKPVDYLANQSNVESLLNNVDKIEFTEQITSGTDYGEFKLDDKQALQVKLFAGKAEKAKLFFGDSGTRGQMARTASKAGVYAVKGFTKYLYSRDLKGWRERQIFKFDDKKAKTVDIVNESGTFHFEKETVEAEEGAKDKKAKDTWAGTFQAADSSISRDIKELDPAKVKDLLRAYKALNADAFGDGKTVKDVGLEEPAATLTITLEDGAKRIAKIGASSEGSSRWMTTAGTPQIFSISSFAADWALAEVDKFKKKKGDAKKKPPGPPGGMGMPPGMPPMGGGMH